MASSGDLAKVFVDSKEHAWVPAVVLSKTETEIRVQLSVDSKSLDEHGATWLNERIVEDNAAGELRTIKIGAMKGGRGEDAAQGQLPLRDDTAFTGSGVLDMTNLNYLHEAAILYNLRTRFLAAQPYTYTGDICIAVNPYQWLDVYTESTRKEYFIFGRNELPPHAYATSAAAFNGVQEGGPNQSILVSGESGAGKTETVKILMAHVAYIAAGDDQTVIRRILESNPLLESFGNAKTVRNDNSSRFGKFTELQFDVNSRLIGSVSRTYLLEKSRVINQSEGERNFHIFHQAMAAEQPSLRAKLDPNVTGYNLSDYAYVREFSTEQLIEGKSDAERLRITCDALLLINVDDAAQDCFFSIIAGILLIGQLRFGDKDGDTETSAIVDPSILEPISMLLGVDGNLLLGACTERTMRARDDVYKVPLKAHEAESAASGLSKELYSRLFDHLVRNINASTSAATPMVHRTIALLDIFGFEMFKINSFEQLCINFANEKLQQKFTHDVFKTVQAEYEEEGIEWNHIGFTDNAQTLQLIEARMGVISVLNEECMRPMGNDEAFTSKLTTLHTKHPDFSKPKIDSKKRFNIRHYAGTVTYTADGFLEKNKDALQEDFVECMLTSCVELVAHLFTDKPASAASTSGAPSGAKKKGSLMQQTVSTKFKTQLGQLMETIGATNVQYVRCIKPNAVKSKDAFTMAMVVEQLRCAGVIEAIRISRAGYPNKLFHKEFIVRFGLLAPNSAVAIEECVPGSSQSPRGAASSPSQTTTARQDLLQCRAIIETILPGQRDRYDVGNSRIYFKAGVLEELEAHRSTALTKSAVTLQRYLRGFVELRRFVHFKMCAVKIQAVLRTSVARSGFVAVRRQIIVVQSFQRAREAYFATIELREHTRARSIQTYFRMSALRWRFRQKKYAAERMQAWARMIIARAAYVIAAAEAKEQAKMENQLAALQRRLDDEAVARSKMEEENAALQERLQSGKALAGSAAHNDDFHQQQLHASANTIVVDQAILDESSQMLEFLQKENSKVKNENAKLHREIAKLQREAAHLRQSADTAEATMKVLSQHAKALAQAHMKLQSAKEEADANIKRSVVKEERLTEELQMKHAMYIAEVNARIQDREVMGSMVSLAESDPSCPDELVFKLRDFLERSAQTGMDVDDDHHGSKQGTVGYRRMSMMFKGLFDN